MGRAVTAQESRDVAGERAFRRMAVAIGVTSTVVFIWFVLVGRADLAQSRGFGDVFDVQARALMGGHLDVPDGSLGFEGFVIGGRTYAYFGIFPALLRVPLFLVTDQLDGRLTAISMIVAYIVALVGAFRVVGRVRALLGPRRPRPWSGRGLLLAGSLLAVIGVGSNLLFLASGAWVYHEASLWGAAAVLASFAAICDFLQRPRPTPVVVAGVWCLVAWTSRGSVGLAPSTVLGLLAVAHLTGARWLAWLAPAPLARSDQGADPGSAAPAGGAWPRNRRLGALLLVAAVAGGLAFGAVNAAKFGSPTALPMDKQITSQHPPPERAAALAAYDGGLFSVRLFPSVLAQTLRPDLVSPRATWPFLGFTRAEPPTPGGLVFDTVEPSAGLTVTSPLLLVMGAVGAVAVLRRRRSAPEPDAAVLRPFLLGGVLATCPVLSIAFIAQRYLTDALPLLVVAASAGLVVIERRWAPATGDQARAARPSGRHSVSGTGAGIDTGPGADTGTGAARMAGICGVVALAVVGATITLAVTWTFQRFVIPPDPAAEAAALRTQMAVSRVIGAPPRVDEVPRLPGEASGGELVVVGDCAGLYRGRGDGGWTPLERTPGVGRYRLAVDLSAPLAGRQAIVAIGSPEDRAVVALEPAGDRARMVLVRNGAASDPGAPFAISEPVELVVVADPASAWTKVFVDGSEVLYVPGEVPARSVTGLGADPDGVVAPFAGQVDVLPSPTPTCDDLVGSS